MNQSNKGASLKTRLSPLAKPFTLNRSSHQPSSSSSVHSAMEPSGFSLDHSNSDDPFGSLLDSFPKFNLGAKGRSVVSVPLVDYGIGHETATARFTVETDIQTQEKPLFQQHPSLEFHKDGAFDELNGSDFDMLEDISLPMYSPNITGLGYGTCNGDQLIYGEQGADYHESLFGKGSDGGSSAADGSMLQKGNHVVDGLNPCLAVSDDIFRNCTRTIVTEDILSNPEDKIHATVEPSSVLMSNSEVAPFMLSTSSAAKLKNTPQNQSCYLDSILTDRNFVSNGASDGQCFSKASSLSNVVIDPTGNHPAPLHGSSSSSACLAFFPFDSSRNMDFLMGNSVTNDDKNYLSSSMFGTKDSVVTLNADGKGSIDDGKEKKIGKSVSNDVTDYSPGANCRVKISSTSIPTEVLLESHGTKAGVSIETSTTNLDNDSDLDSPCWKGTMAFCLSPPEISGSVQSQHVEKGLEKYNTLNPLAPQFFPGNVEGSSYCGSGYVKDDIVSSKSCATSAINLLPGEDRPKKAVMDDVHPLELKNGIELQHSSNIYQRVKAFDLLNDPKSSSVEPVLNSSCMMTESFPIEDCSTSKGKLVTDVDVDGCIKRTKDSASGSISGSFPRNSHSPTPTSTSSTQVGAVTDLFKTLQGVSKSLIESPKLDVQIMVNAMHVLSELLVQTCEPGLDSYNEHDNHMIQQIINNLNVFSTKNCGQRIPTHGSTHAGNPYCLDRSSELPKHSNKELEVTSIENLAVPHKLNHQNDFMGQNSVSRVVGERGPYSFASSSDVGNARGNEIVQLQVIQRSLGKSLDVEKQMHPEALLFRNLWLDSEAERCFRRYKTYLWLREAGMDVNCTNVADLWR